MHPTNTPHHKHHSPQVQLCQGCVDGKGLCHQHNALIANPVPPTPPQPPSVGTMKHTMQSNHNTNITYRRFSSVKVALEARDCASEAAPSSPIPLPLQNHTTTMCGHNKHTMQSNQTTNITHRRFSSVKAVLVARDCAIEAAPSSPIPLPLHHHNHHVSAQ